MDKKATGIIGYIGLIGFLVAYLAGDQQGAKFHLNQALVLHIATAIGGAVFGGVATAFAAIPLLGTAIAVAGGALSGLWGILMLVLMVLGIINAVNDQDTPLPIIGGFEILK